MWKSVAWTRFIVLKFSKPRSSSFFHNDSYRWIILEEVYEKRSIDLLLQSVAPFFAVSQRHGYIEK